MSVYSGYATSKATKDASQLSSQVQTSQFDQTQANQAPWLQAGTQAVNQLAAGTQAGGQFATTPAFSAANVNLAQDPGYQFRMQQGQDALTAGSAAHGNYGSGSLGVALQQYGQNLGSQEYGQAYSRALDEYNAAMNSQNTLFNRLSGVAGTGQVAANNLAATGANVASNVGNNLMQGGITAAGQRQAGVTGLENQLVSGYQAYNQNQLYNRYLDQMQSQTAQQNLMGRNVQGNTDMQWDV